MDDLKTFLVEKVLLFESDTLSPETEKVCSRYAATEPMCP